MLNRRFFNAGEVIDYIENRKNNHRGLENFQACMKTLDDPHLKLSCIHIAGTNGKGSTTNYLRSILQANGYRVATFTSPYLEVHNDRIRINDENISDDDICDLANQTYPLWEQYDLSMFEIDMMFASLYFVREKVDFAIFEVGLGGRIDASNLVDPLLSIITNIGLDHMEFLGNTHALIAKEKAGIIKPHRDCLTGETRKDCLEVMDETCNHRFSKLLHVGEISNVSVLDHGHVCFDYRQFKGIQLDSMASYQSKNAACAIEAALYLRNLGYLISDASIYEGCISTYWKGRFEQVHDHPWIMIDGAHNEHGIAALVESAKIFPKVKILFSALKGKNSDVMIERLLTLSDDLTVCEFAFARAQKAEKIAQNYPVKIDKDVFHAIDESLDYDGVILITGSLYFISLVREYCRQLK